MFLDASGGTASATDLAGVLPAFVTIPAGKSSVVLTITCKDDAELEGTESVVITLTPDDGYVINGSLSTATGQILDDEKATITIVANGDINEDSSSPGTFTITRTGPTTDPIFVNFLTTGTAKSGVDYVALAKSVTIPAGSESVDISVTPSTDHDIEGPESVIVTLAGGSYVIGSQKPATMKIVDVQKPSIRIEALDDTGDLTETATFRIWRTGQTAGESLVVHFDLTDMQQSPDAFVIKDSTGKVLTDSVAIPSGFAFVDVLVTASAPTAENQNEMNLALLQDPAYQIDNAFRIAHANLSIRG